MFLPRIVWKSLWTLSRGKKERWVPLSIGWVMGRQHLIEKKKLLKPFSRRFSTFNRTDQYWLHTSSLLLLLPFFASYYSERKKNKQQNAHSSPACIIKGYIYIVSSPSIWLFFTLLFFVLLRLNRVLDHIALWDWEYPVHSVWYALLKLQLKRVEKNMGQNQQQQKKTCENKNRFLCSIHKANIYFSLTIVQPSVCID